jgi:hypothetical protein
MNKRKEFAEKRPFVLKDSLFLWQNGCHDVPMAGV